MENNKLDEALQLMVEQRRGQEMLAREALAREFDPNYDPMIEGTRAISYEERRRRDEYRKHLGQWKKLYEG